MWWTKPWNYVWQQHDRAMQGRAERLAMALSTYYGKWEKYPWNAGTGNFIPSPAELSPQSPFAAPPVELAVEMGLPSSINRDWLLDYFGFLNLSAEDQEYWQENDNVVVLKVISDSSRVAVCFEPRSAYYQGLAATACFTDDFGRRNAPHIINEVDVCATIDGEAVAANNWLGELNLTWPQGASANWSCVSAYQGRVE